MVRNRRPFYGGEDVNLDLTAMQRYIRSGNAGGVKISLNQKPAQLMGKAGQIGEITLTAPPQ